MAVNHSRLDQHTLNLTWEPIAQDSAFESDLSESLSQGWRWKLLLGLTIIALIAQSVLHLVLLSDLFGFAMRAAATEVSFITSLDSTWVFMVALQIVFLAATSVFFYCLLHTTRAPQRITVYKHDFNE